MRVVSFCIGMALALGVLSLILGGVIDAILTFTQ